MIGQDKKLARNHKKRGRPATGTSPTVGVRMGDDLVSKIDAWRARQRPIPSLPEAIRTLIETHQEIVPLVEQGRAKR